MAAVEHTHPQADAAELTPPRAGAAEHTRPPADAADRRAAHRLVRHIVAGWRCQAIHTAVQLALPEALADGPRGAAELASALACDADGLHRLLRALCSLGVCRQAPDERFVLTRMGRLLLAGHDGQAPSLRALAQWWGGPLWNLWSQLPYSVRTGRSARERDTGSAGYGFLDRDGDAARVFHEAQRAMTALVLDELCQWPGWGAARSLVDVGGGHGQVALAVLAAHPHLRGTVLDLPHAGAGARQCIGRSGLSRRCQFEPGSFLEQVPAGADVLLLKSILHNWDDAHCRTILRRCAEALPAQGTLLIVERVPAPRLRPGARDEAAARTDLNMLAGLGGRERTEAQFAALLAEAGFELHHTQPLAFEFSLLVAGHRAAGVAPAAATSAPRP